MSLWIKIGLAMALVVALFFGVNRYNGHQQGIGYDRAMDDVRKQENADLKAALRETERLNKIITEAQDAAKRREAANRQLSVRNAALLERLRDTDARIDALVSSATADALRNATRAYAGLFADCRADFEGMGRAAAGHRSDVEKLGDAWPTK